MNLYLPNGPEVWRISYGYQFEQFDTLEKAMRYIRDNLESKNKHMLLIQRVNLREIKNGKR